MPGKRIEIPVVVQQVIPALDASGSNHRNPDNYIANNRWRAVAQVAILERVAHPDGSFRMTNSGFNKDYAARK